MTDVAQSIGSELIERLRSSIVEVISTSARGSGFVGLANGLVVTSLSVVGFEREVQLVYDDGSVGAAMVVRANVGLDIALLMPLVPHGLTHFEVGPDATLGDDAMVIGRQGGEPFAIATRVLSVSRMAEGFAHNWIDVPQELSLRGAPLMDQQGRAIGLMVRPRLVRERGGRRLRRWVHGLVLPVSSFEGGLYSAEGSPAEVLEYAPEYGCQNCDTIFEPDMDRCLECGVMLPHRWPPADEEGLGEAPDRGVFAVKAALASIGITANLVRVGPRTWQFMPSFQDRARDIGRTLVDLTMDAPGDHLFLRAPVMRLPAANYEQLYRHLLTLNDETSEMMRLSVFDQTVYLALCLPTGSIDQGSFPTAVSELSTALARYRSLLCRDFGGEPAFSHQLD